MKNRPKKKKQTSMYIAVSVGVVIIALSVFFVYSSEQAKIRGEAFGKAIEFVQEDLRKTYHSFDSKVSKVLARFCIVLTASLFVFKDFV